MVESIGEDLPLLDLGRAVQSQVSVAVDVEELFEDVEHLGHLREDKRSVAACLQLAQKLV